jgi:hypothetical protein
MHFITNAAVGFSVQRIDSILNQRVLSTRALRGASPDYNSMGVLPEWVTAFGNADPLPQIGERA